jgi:F-type H+-transporting ATPase subunit epsilon
VHGGFVEVSNNKVTILSDVAELAGDIDAERARRAKDAAEAAYRAEPTDENDAALRRATLRASLAA